MSLLTGTFFTESRAALPTLLREPDGECWDTGPVTVPEPNYKALLDELVESLGAYSRSGAEQGDYHVGSIYLWQDVMASLEDIAMQMAGVNP